MDLFNTTTYVEGKRDPTPIWIEDKEDTILYFNPIKGWKLKHIDVKDGNIIVTIGTDKPLKPKINGYAIELEE